MNLKIRHYFIPTKKISKIQLMKEQNNQHDPVNVFIL